MANTNEFENILSEMDARSKREDFIAPCVLKDYTERLKVVVAESATTTGNAAAMREALEFLRDKELYLLEGNVRHCIGLTVFGLEQTCKIMRGVIEEALAAPPRNCDVGTAEEQYDRFYAFCASKGYCDACDLCVNKGFLCDFVWAQMPYESEVAQ